MSTINFLDLPCDLKSMIYKINYEATKIELQHKIKTKKLRYGL